MTICLRCHRPLKNPSPSGFGPVCAKAVKPVPEVERDLFGYDEAAAATAVRVKQGMWLEARCAEVQRELDAEFKAAWARWEARA